MIAMNVVGPTLQVGGQVGKRVDGKARGVILGTFGRRRKPLHVAASRSTCISSSKLSAFLIN